MKKVRCFNCGREKMFESEGRFADGSWADDERLSEDAKGKWFCSYSCYKKVLEGGNHAGSNQ